MKKVICLFGPTGSGKTDLSIKIAKSFNLSIISADSMQVYREMDIGTAKITDAQKSGVKHYLIDIRNPDDYFSTNDFFKESISIINECHKNNTPAFVVGGTGLYFKSLFYGMFDTPKKNDELRELLSKKYDENPENMYEELKKIDPDYAAIIHINDKKRIIRAFEIYNSSNTAISKMENIIPDFDFLKLGIMPERSILYERINNRCEEMITRGLIDETKKLLEKYGNEQQAFQAIGYSHIIRLINHEFDENELIRLFKRDTRRFAKRQFTLFKTFSNVNWISNINITEIEKKINDFLVL